SKLMLAEAALASGLADDPAMEHWVIDGFPKALVERFPEAIKTHRLKRELIATLVANQMVDRLGITSAQLLPANFATRMEAAVFGYGLADAWLDGETLYNAIEALDNVIPAADQYRAQLVVTRLLRHAVNWWLTSESGRGLAELIQRFQGGARELLAN